jgi:hypothetical protein
MLLQILAVASLSLSGQAPTGPRALPIGFVDSTRVILATASDTVKKRPHAIEYSDAYFTRLQIHRIASYTEFPLFAAEYVIGERLIKEDRTGFPSSGLKTAHQAVALGLAGLFGINTITGVWNLWDSRQDPSGRARRLIHSALMLGADAGFALAGASGGDASETNEGTNNHRTIALTSMGIAAAGTVMMWLTSD